MAAIGKLGRSSKSDTTVQECLLQLAVILTKVELERVLQICYFSRKVPSLHRVFNYIFCLKRRR